MPSLKGSLVNTPLYLASTWRLIPSEARDPGRRAVQYLGVIRDLAINPAWIGLSDAGADCSTGLEWLGTHLDSLNCRLNDVLQDCLECFHAEQRPAVQIFAAPILPKAGIDGFCNLTVCPITLVIDPSRVDSSEWHKLVIHELAHGVAQSAGHGENFRQALAHLCLAYDLPEPPLVATLEDQAQPLRSWPPYTVRLATATLWHAPVGVLATPKFCL